MKTLITVIGKRWFQKTYGNTYHSVRVTILDVESGEEQEFYEPFMYGYDDQYRVTATKLLKANTDILNKVSEGNREYGLTYWRVVDELKDNNIVVKFFCEDVQRKKDL